MQTIFHWLAFGPPGLALGPPGLVVAFWIPKWSRWGLNHREGPARVVLRRSGIQLHPVKSHCVPFCNVTKRCCSNVLVLTSYTTRTKWNQRLCDNDVCGKSHAWLGSLFNL